MKYDRERTSYKYKYIFILCIAIYAILSFVPMLFFFFSCTFCYIFFFKDVSRILKRKPDSDDRFSSSLRTLKVVKTSKYTKHKTLIYFLSFFGQIFNLNNIIVTHTRIVTINV